MVCSSVRRLTVGASARLASRPAPRSRDPRAGVRRRRSGLQARTRSRAPRLRSRPSPYSNGAIAGPPPCPRNEGQLVEIAEESPSSSGTRRTVERSPGDRACSARASELTSLRSAPESGRRGDRASGTRGLVDPGLELLGQRVLEAVRLGVHLLDGQAERLDEVPLEQPVMAEHLDCACGRPRSDNAVVRLVLGELEGSELFHHRRRGRGETSTVRRARRSSPGAGRVQLVDLLQVVLGGLGEIG